MKPDFKVKFCCGKISRLIAITVIVLGSTVLLGWVFNLTLLKSVHPDWVAMKPNTALAFLLGGFSLWLHGKGGG